MTIWTLLVLYQLKHFLADYPLQSNRFMLGKFLDKGWVKPLLAHVAVHGVMTAGIACLAGRPGLALPLMVFDAGIHFVMDRLKAGSKYMGRWKALSASEFPGVVKDLNGESGIYRLLAKDRIRGNTLFWNCLGIDQMVHHLTHYACIAMLLT